jgi:hypothetical protein
MNDDLRNGDPFERRRSNRAVLMVVGMAFVAMALNQGVHALSAPAAHREPARTSSPRPHCNRPAAEAPAAPASTPAR